MTEPLQTILTAKERADLIAEFRKAEVEFTYNFKGDGNVSVHLEEHFVQLAENAVIMKLSGGSRHPFDIGQAVASIMQLVWDYADPDSQMQRTTIEAAVRVALINAVTDNAHEVLVKKEQPTLLFDICTTLLLDRDTKRFPEIVPKIQKLVRDAMAPKDQLNITCANGDTAIHLSDQLRKEVVEMYPACREWTLMKRLLDTINPSWKSGEVDNPTVQTKIGAHAREFVRDLHMNWSAVTAFLDSVGPSWREYEGDHQADKVTAFISTLMSLAATAGSAPTSTTKRDAEDQHLVVMIEACAIATRAFNAGFELATSLANTIR